MQKNIEEMVNDLDIQEIEYTDLYNIFTEAGITGSRWFRVANYIQRHFKMNYHDKVEKDKGIEFLIMVMAKGYDDGLRDAFIKVKK